MTRPLRRSDGRVDASIPAEILERQVRAYLPWPGSFLEAGGERLVVLAGRVAPSDSDDEPGRLVPDPAGLALATVDGRLVLDEVQAAGRRPMTGEAFLRGHPSILGRLIRKAADARDADDPSDVAERSRPAADPA